MNARRALLVALCAALGAALGAAQDATTQRRGAEGALDNDAYLPQHAEAAALFASADRRQVELAGQPLDAAHARAWTEVLEAWHAALRDSATGDMLAPRPVDAAHPVASPWPDPDGTADTQLDRRREGVEYAALRRLRAASPALRGLWRERFGGLGTERLAQAGRDVARLREVERAFPATEAAARAALALADAELECARPRATAAWLARARAHVELAQLDRPLWNSSLERRAAAAQAELAALEPALGAHAAWSDARTLSAVTELLIDPSPANWPRSAPEPGLGVRAGMCFLGGPLAALQFPGVDDAAHGALVDRVTLLDLERGRRLGTFTPARMLESFDVRPGALERPLEAPGWPLLPAASGHTLVLTLGRRGWERGNALVAIEVQPAADGEAPPLPRLRWAWYDGARIAGPPDASAPYAWRGVEFQPGALIRGDDVFVVAREYVAAGEASPDGSDARPLTGAEIRTWLLALDLASGAPRWRVYLGKGFELQRGRLRFLSPNVVAASAQPPLEVGGRVFVGTHTGAGALVDAVDGRVAWALKCRRRAPDQRTWSGARAPSDESARALVWAPADSDHVYWLRAEPDLDGTGLFLHPPRAIGEGELLIGGDADGALVASRAGAERALAGWNARSGRTCSAPNLGPAEGFGGDGLASPTRALFASTRGVWLLDRTRDLYLLDYAALKPLRGPGGASGVPGGSLFAHGRWVCALGATTLWIFEASP